MSKVSLKEAIDLTGKSESTIRRDMRSGKVSYTKTENGRVNFDTAELTRFYGELKPVDTATDTSNDIEMNGNDTPVDTDKIIALLEKQNENLQKQLDIAGERETALTAEKSQLLDLLSAEKEEKRLMLPAPPKKNGFFGLFQRR